MRSDRRNLLELSRIAQDAFVERLQTIPNVASVDIWGEKTYAMRLWIRSQQARRPPPVADRCSGRGGSRECRAAVGAGSKVWRWSFRCGP